MRRLELITMLEEAGFTLKRLGARHILYEHPTGLVVPVSHGKDTNPRRLACTKAIIRKLQRQEGT